jgi:hypothetical protein
MPFSTDLGVTTVIATPNLFQSVEVHFPNGYTVSVAVQARVGDITSVYVQTPDRTAHLTNITEEQMTEIILMRKCLG